MYEYAWVLPLPLPSTFPLYDQVEPDVEFGCVALFKCPPGAGGLLESTALVRVDLSEWRSAAYAGMTVLRGAGLRRMLPVCWAVCKAHACLAPWVRRRDEAWPPAWPGALPGPGS